MQKKYNIEVSPTSVEQGTLDALYLRLMQNINHSKKSVEKFEQAISEITGAEEVLAVSSGTAALHLSMLALGLQEGDYIACSTFTFVATVNAIGYINANPVFIDSEDVTWNMCPDLLEKAIIEGQKSGKRIRAVIVVHTYGFPAKIEEIVNLCQLHNIPVIEDAASALGSTYKNRWLGTFGTIGIISFNYNKIITTTGGGVFLTRSRSIRERAAYFANQAKSSTKENEHEAIGYNYKMSGMCAELGTVQLPYLKKYIGIKRAIYDRYRRALNNIEGIRFLEEPSDDFFSNRWITPILFPEKELKKKVKRAFEENYVEDRSLWKPMHHQPVFSTCLSYTNGKSENFFDSGLCLPSGINLKPNEQELVIGLIRTFF